MKKIEMNIGEKFEGFYFYTPNVDYFFITSKNKKTPNLVKLIENILIESNCTYRGLFDCRNVKNMLDYASIEKKQISNGRTYFSILGDGFSYGDFEDKKTTVIYKID